MLERSAMWQRLDVNGTEHVLYDDRAGMRARGVVLSTGPVPHTCRYQIVTGEDWATRVFEVEAEGAGWQRQVRLERSTEGWRVTTHERGRLDRVLAQAGKPGAALPGTDIPDELGGALDIDLLASPFTNTLPIRRLRLLDAAADTERRITAAFVLVPTLTVVASEQSYTPLGPSRVRYASGTFHADLTVDGDGLITHYPGLADRIA